MTWEIVKSENKYEKSPPYMRRYMLGMILPKLDEKRVCNCDELYGP